MSNYLQAPEIKNNGIKNRDNQGWGKAIRTHELETIIMNGLGERDMAMLKVMLFLTGNAEGFKVAEKTIMDRCKISESGYKNAKKKLQQMGWITCKAGQSITVNYDNIYKSGEALLNDDESENKKEMGVSQNTPQRYCENTPSGQCENTYNNITNKIKDNINISIPKEGEYITKSRESLILSGAKYQELDNNFVKILATGKIIKII